MVKITRMDAEKLLGEVSQEKRFRCSDGRMLKTLPELEVALKEISEETFRYHCNKTKSDFSNWVRDVIGDEELSEELRKSTTQAKAAKSVASRVAWLRRKAAKG